MPELSFVVNSVDMSCINVVTLSKKKVFMIVLIIRVDSYQLEWANMKTVWWNHLRIVHGLLYLGFSISVFLKKDFGTKQVPIKNNAEYI